VKPSILVHSVVLSARSPTMDRLIMDQKRRLTTRHARYIIEVRGEWQGVSEGVVRRLF
jgi:hypothetical protein